MKFFINREMFILIGLVLFLIFLNISNIQVNSKIKFNTTESLPLGFYIENSEPIKKGDIIYFCPPNREIFQFAKTKGYVKSGVCEGDLKPLLKIVGAVADDEVTISKEGVFVNNEKIINSKPNSKELTFHEMDNCKLKDDEIIVITDNINSFDSRYFGVVSNLKYIKKVKPLLVWKK